MAYKLYAKADDFCKVCSPYQVGDIVFLLRDYKTSKGVFEKGTLLVVSAVELNGVKIPTAFKGEEANYEINENAFKYRMRLHGSKEEITQENGWQDMYFFPHDFEKITKEPWEEITEEEFQKAIEKKKTASAFWSWDTFTMMLIVLGIIVGLIYTAFDFVSNGFNNDTVFKCLTTIIAVVFWMGFSVIATMPLTNYRFKLKEKKKK